MNRALAIIWFISLSLSGNIWGQNTPEYVEVEKHAAKEIVNFTEKSNINTYDVVYHKINWIIDPASRYIKGSVLSVFKAKTTTHTIVFDLDNQLSVDSITAGDKKLSFIHEEHALTINLGETLNTEQIDSLTIYYQGEPSTSGFGSFNVKTHNNTPVLWTLSEPYGAREWWPCKQSLTDKIDSIDIYIETPKAYRVGSNGKLMYENIEGDTRYTYWKHRHPIATYLVAIAVTDYSSYSHYAKVNNIDSVEILNYVYPENLESAKIQTKYTVDVVELFSRKFIPYPFADEKYGHAQFGWGGGMEHQTMSFMGGFSESLIAHELAHQWFGNHVTCASWQDIWVNEGFAVFCEGLAIENLYPEKWLAWKKKEIDRVVRNSWSGSVFVEDTSSVNNIFNYDLTYKKGGAILTMLRYQIGDKAFFEGTQQLLTHQSTSKKFASAEDVQSFFEVAADTLLTEYFNDWYYGEGYPKYTIEVTGSSKKNTTIKLSQQTTNSSVDFFELKIPICFYYNGNSTTKIFHNTQNGQNFTVELGSEIDSIVFDPEYTIIAPHPAIIIYPKNIRKKLEKLIVVSPNPSRKTFNIDYPDGISITNYELYSITGKLLAQHDVPDSEKPIVIESNEFNPGKLILKIRTEDSYITKQLVKI